MREAAGPPEQAGAAGPPPPRAARGGVTRRGLLGGTGAVGAGLLAGAMGGCAAGSAGGAGTAGPAASATPVPFCGPHQAGIITSAQDRLAFGALNLAGGVTRSDLRDLLREWTRAAELMTRGRPAGPAADPSAPPTDTGEATGLPAARLTITIGYGPSLFDGRLGLSSRKPAALRPLPVLANEDLDPGRSGGDLCLQACSDDPQVAFHAVRNLARGYSFTDGIVPETGTLDGGLFFIAYMRDPAQFVRLQQSLTGDALNEYIRHVSSAVFVCPPGLRPGQDWGGVLFG